MALAARELFVPNLKRTRDEAFCNEEEAFEFQRKWFIHEKQVVEANPCNYVKICEKTVDQLFSGSKNFWMGNTQLPGCSATTPPPSSESSFLFDNKSNNSHESPAQRSITSYFQIASKHPSSDAPQNDLPCAMDTDEPSNRTMRSLPSQKFACEGGRSAPSAASGVCLAERGSLERQLTIDSRGCLSASFAPPSSPKTIHNRCHCNTGGAQLQSCSDCHKSLCDDCLRVCYRCSKLFCRDCRMNSFLYEKNKTACYQCLG